MSWENIPFNEAITDVTGGNRKFKSSEYLESGDFPIIDQGEDFIAGFTNENAAIKIDYPLIIFGDHTRVLKYVDFDFCLGADGVKVLKTSQSLLPKYIYYYLIFANIPNMGYSRHFKFLKELEFPLPPLPIQQKIAEKLDKADALRKKDQELLKYYDELAQSVFIEMFGDPVRNEKGWEIVKLEGISNLSSGSTPSRENKKFYDGNIPWVKTTEVNGTVILDTQENISEEALKNSSCRLNPIGSLIIAMYGQGKTRGQVGILGIEAATNQACCVIPPSEKINFDFLFNQIRFLYDDLRNLGRGGNQPNLNLGILKNYEVLNPPLPLQQKFATIIQNIELQKQKVKLQAEESENLFQALLQESFA